MVAGGSAMFSLQAIADRARAVRVGVLEPEVFQDWFSDYAFGHRGAQGDRIADALADIDMVLTEFELEEFDSAEFGERVCRAIHPYVLQRVYADSMQIEIGPAWVRAASSSPALTVGLVA